MPRLTLLLALVCALALTASAQAGPIDFEYHLRYDGVAPLTLSSGAEGSFSINVTGGMSGHASATDSVSAALNYTITSTAPSTAPSEIEVAVLRFTLFVKDAISGIEWMLPQSVYIHGAVNSTTEFFDGVEPFSTWAWLGEDRKYTVDFDFLASGQNHGTGQVSVSITAAEEQQPPAAPEPSTLALAGLGFTLPLVQRLRNRKC